jgi:5'-deoxynucleotidase YfbR-like HD superfamily hydrolase
VSLLLETVSGRKIDVLDPDPKDISIEDIAWGLSRIPRFCGATIPFIPYSVAQHSIQVMKECGASANINMTAFGRLAFHGLMHDAAEAYTGDIPSPIKQIPGFKEQIKEVENNLLATIYKAFDTDLPSEEDMAIVHNADMVQRAIEAYNFMYSRGRDWNLPPIPFQKLQEFDPPMISIKAYDMFLQHFNELKGIK